MNNRQFYRSKLIFSALKDQDNEKLNFKESSSASPGFQNSLRISTSSPIGQATESIEPANHLNEPTDCPPLNDAYETSSNDVYNNPIPGSSKEPVFSNDSEDDVYNNPMPGSSNKPVFINESDDDISEISNSFNSDDSVADPDFSLTDLFKNMFYKYDFDEPYQELDFLMKKHDIRVLPRMLDTPRGIKESKKEGIVKKLVPLMPMNRRDFWLQLPTSNDSQDLVTGGQIIDNDI